MLSEQMCGIVEGPWDVHYVGRGVGVEACVCGGGGEGGGGSVDGRT